MRFKEFLMQERTKDGFRDMTYDEIKAADGFARKNKIGLGSGRVHDKSGEIHVSGPDAKGRHRHGVVPPKKKPIKEAPGKVHIIKRAEPRGEPEVSARGLDMRDKDRSVLPQLAKDESTFEVVKDGGHTEWFSPESDILMPGGAYLQFYVNNKLGDKFLIHLPLKHSRIELDDAHGFDISGKNERLSTKYEKEILKTALAALASGVKIDGIYNGLDKNGHFTEGPMPGVAKYRRAHA